MRAIDHAVAATSRVGEGGGPGEPEHHGGLAVRPGVDDDVGGGSDRDVAAGHVDEDWQISRWGADTEAAARRARRLAEMQAASRLLILLRQA